jgi:hypothetical protein
MRNRRVYAALAFVCAALFAKFLMQPAGMVLSSRSGDLWHIGYPLRAAAGGTPLWFSSQYCGMPLDSKLQFGPFYPFNLVFDFMPLWRAFNFAFIFHVLLAGFGMALFLTEMELGPAAAFLGAVSFMLCGAITGRISPGHLDIISSLAWTGFVFWAAHRMIKKPGLKTAAAFALCGALQLLCGHPQFFYITESGAFVYCLWLVYCSAERKKPVKFMLCGLAGMLLVSTVGWLPLLAFAKYSSRAQAAMGFAGTFSFPPLQLANFALPGFFGSGPAYWGEWYPWELCAYVGLGTLFFLPALKRGPENRNAFLFLWLALGAFFIALGKYNPLFFFIYKVLPGFSSFRCPSRFIALAAFSLCVAGAYAFDGVLRAADDERIKMLKAPVIAAISVMLLGLFVLLALRADNFAGMRAFMAAELSSPDRMANYGPFKYSPQAVYGLIFGGWLKMSGILCALLVMVFAVAKRRTVFAFGICCVAVVDMFSFCHGRVTCFDTGKLAALAPVADYVRAQGHPARVAGLGVGAGILNASGLETADGYDAFSMAACGEFLNYSQGLPPGADTGPLTALPPMLAYMNLQYVVSPADLPEGGLLRKVQSFDLPDGGLKLYRWTPGLERFYFSPAFEVMPRENMLERLSSWRPGEPPLALLEENPGITPSQAARGGAVIKVIGMSPSAIELEVNSQTPGILAVSQNWYPGWRATVNGVTSKVLRTNYFMQGVALSAGTSRVELSYVPALLYCSLCISLLGALALGAALLLC